MYNFATLSARALRSIARLRDGSIVDGLTVVEDIPSVFECAVDLSQGQFYGLVDGKWKLMAWEDPCENTLTVSRNSDDGQWCTGVYIDKPYLFADVSSDRILGNKIEPNSLYFGVELESAQVIDKLAVTARQTGLWIGKEDGSCGVEFVSKALPYEQMLAAIDILQSADVLPWVLPTEKCGMHVHISRSFFVSEEAIDLFERWVLLAQSKGAEIIGRKANGYCKNKKWKAEVDPELGRYTAVNRVNPHTVEVRVFTSTQDPSLMKARVQWVKFLAEYANEQVGNTHEFEDFVEASGFNYEFVKEAERNGHINNLIIDGDLVSYGVVGMEPLRVTVNSATREISWSAPMPDHLKAVFEAQILEFCFL